MIFETRRFNASGIWTSMSHVYYNWALEEHHKFTSLLKQIFEDEAHACQQMEKEGIDASDRPFFLSENIFEMHGEAYRHATIFHLFACMAIEGFLNVYGVRRLGGDFYKESIERIGITEKFAVIGAISAVWDIRQHPEIRNDLRILFDKRNSLVHPKAKEFFSHNIHKAEDYLHPRELGVAENFGRLQTLISFFVAMDPDVASTMQFSAAPNDGDVREAATAGKAAAASSDL